MSQSIETPQNIDQSGQEARIVAPKSLALSLIIGGFIAWIGAFSLVIERIQLAEHPSGSLSCDLNVFISCKSVMLTWQSHLLGFPNPLIGVAGFAIPIVVGFAILAGARFAQWFWVAFVVGIGAAMAFILWLFSQSLLVINVLCPYCMVSWVGTIMMFVPLALFAFREDIIEMPVRTTAFWDAAYPKAWLFVIGVDLLIVLAIVIRFWSRWPILFHR